MQDPEFVRLEEYVGDEPAYKAEGFERRSDVWDKFRRKYPKELNELIGNSPIRQGWKKDAWNREYQFEITNNGKGFLITSAGSDGKFKTEDDIKSQ